MKKEKNNTKKNKSVDSVKTENKILNVTFYQNENGQLFNSYQWNIELNEKTENNVIFGTVLNELFTLVSESKEIGAKLFRLNNPIMLKTEFNGIILDTCKAKKVYQQKLKLQNNAKSKKRFANRTNIILNSITRAVKIVDINTLLASLND